MTIEKRINSGYSDGIPNITDDRNYAQDLIRDFQHRRDVPAKGLKDIIGQVPILMDGGIVSHGTSFNTLAFTAGFGYVAFSVEIPDDYSEMPPQKLTQNIVALRIEWPTLTDVNNSNADYNPVFDNVTLNYAKIRFKETDGNTRTRVLIGGVYVYEVTDDYEIIVDEIPPTDLDLTLVTFISDGPNHTFIDANLDRISVTAFKECGQVEVKAGVTITLEDLVVLNSDGTVVPGIAEPGSISPDIQNPHDSKPEAIDGALLNPNLYVMIWRTPSTFVGKVRAIIVNDDDTINFGSFGDDETFLGSFSSELAITRLTDTSFIIAYVDLIGTGDTFARVCTVSGTTITLGPQSATILASSGSRNSLTRLTDTKFVIAYSNGTSNKGDLRVCTISGTTIGLGSVNTFQGSPATINYTSLERVNDDAFVLFYRDQTSDSDIFAVYADVTGTTATLGTPVTVSNLDTAGTITTIKLTNELMVVCFTRATGSSQGSHITPIRIHAVTNVITVEPRHEFTNDVLLNFSGDRLSDREFALTYLHPDSLNTFVRKFNIRNLAASREPIEIGTVNVIERTITDTIRSNKILVNYGISSGITTDRPRHRFVDLTNIKGGIAQDDIATGELVPVKQCGISLIHTDLIPGREYFTEDGTTFNTDGVGRSVGIAIKPTRLLVQTPKIT